MSQVHSILMSCGWSINHELLPSSVEQEQELLTGTHNLWGIWLSAVCHSMSNAHIVQRHIALMVYQEVM